MTIRSASLTIVTGALSQTRAFYEAHFDAEPVFDCGWYVVLRLDRSCAGLELCLMAPRNDMAAFAGGTFFNLLVDNADEIHARLVDAGLLMVIPLEDHPWGDRGFGVVDPSGLVVYCYHPIDPAPEFEQYFVRE